MAKNPPTATTVLPLPQDGFGSLSWWQDAIKAAEEKRNDLADKFWKPNVARYDPTLSGGLLKKAEDEVRVNADFYNTEQKKALLFFRTPHVQLTAKRPNLDDAVVVFQAVLNHKLGPHGVNAAAMMDECLFDLLCPAGIAASVIGYEAVQQGTLPVQLGMQPDPRWTPPTPAEVQPGAVLGLGQPTPQPPMVPQMAEVANIVSRRCFWDRVSPAKVIIPIDFTGSDYDKAAYLGYEFAEDVEILKARGWVPKDFSGSGEDKHRLVDDPKLASRGPVGICRVIWYRASRFDPNVKHPDKFRELILVEGLDAPAVHRDSPFQKFDARGRFVAGMKGNPVHIWALRYVSDKEYPPSDCTISRNQVDELSLGRTQMVQQRKRALPVRWFDRNRVAPEDIDRVKRGEIQGMVPLDGNGAEIIGEVARAEYPRENFTFNDVIQQDIDKEWALGSNQQGVTEDTVRSATELSLIQSNINVRQDYERAKNLAAFVKGAEKLGALIQLFADDEEYVEIVGPDGTQRLQAWDKTTIQGEFAYAAKPDSAQRTDAATDRKNWLDYVNFNAKNPYTNLEYLTRIGSERYGFDPSQAVTKPQPSGPPPPNVSFRFSGDDFVGPASAIVLEIATQAGYKVSPQAVATAAAGQARVEAAQQQEQQAKLQHGGTVDKADVLSKHSGEETGQLSGPTSQQAVV